MRITKKVFLDLAIWMIAFGLSIGIIFPWFVTLLGVPRDIALKPGFYAACLGAGALAGGVNFLLARWVVATRIRVLANGMKKVEGILRDMHAEDNQELCSYETCTIPIDSEDELGDSARAFNRLIKTLSDSLNTQGALQSFSEMLSGTLELETLAVNSLELFLEHTGAAGGAIFYDAGGELKVAATRGINDPEKLAESDHIETALRKGELQKVSLPQNIQVEGVLAAFRPQEIIILPATYKQIPLGVVVLAKTDAFQVEEEIRLGLFIQGFGLALNNALSHDRLQRLAALDPLTGIYNRRFGLGRLHEEFERSVRSAIPLGLLMLDIDHFKSVNDTYGHQTGDRLLKSVSAIIRTILREGDILVRYGGEEFLAILPAAASEDLDLIGERIRRSVEESALMEGQQTIRVTISIGGAAYPNQAVEKESALIQLADESLYQAKETGRNKVIIAK
jgi:diguanylate cyclase (GGDEF)-like protein